MLMVFAQNEIGGWAFVIKLLMGEIPNLWDKQSNLFK